VWPGVCKQDPNLTCDRKTNRSYYDAFVSIQRGLFNTRDRAEHTRKRKLVSHTFSARSVSQFEPYIRANLDTFVARWDALAAAQGASAAVAREPNSDGYAHVDCLKWFNYLAFDIIGDLAFGAPFGMLKAGADVAAVRSAATTSYAPAIQILNRRGEVSATLGCLPELKPWARHLPDPFFSQGLEAVRQLAGIAVAAVERRLDGPGASQQQSQQQERRKDLLARLMEGRDDKGEPLGRDELTAEALTQLIAGSDTTSNSSCALLYHAVRTPHVLPKLRAELDDAVAKAAGGTPGAAADEQTVPSFDTVRDLPYLSAVVNEALRHHSTSAIGLPRQIPHTAGDSSSLSSSNSGGVAIRGVFYPPGTVLSVPTYTIHHSKEIWGPDADEFRPERWHADVLTPRQRAAFNPFGYGSRACVGRNVAEMELKLILATWARRYDVILRQDYMDTREGFLRKPVGLDIGFARRRL
jgi:benzoate 4-monooxygenase